MVNPTKKVLMLAAAISTVVSALGAAPAQAAGGFSVSVDRTANLFRAGDQVSVTVSGTPAGEGVYVMFCATPAQGARPTKCLGRGYWASTDPNMISAHALDLAQPVAVAVQESFTTQSADAVSCATSGCGIFVRRDHMDPTDKSLDTFVPLNFAPTFGVQVSKVAGLANGEDTVNVSVVGLAKNTGVYVRECAKSADASRPADCDGQGIWATNDSQWLAYGATDVSATLALKVHSSFVANAKTIDCSSVVCGIFVRRDHLNGADTSLDTFVPIAFLPQKTAAVSAVKGSGVIVVALSGSKGDAFVLTVNGVKHSVVLAAKSKSLKLTVAKGSSATVTVSADGKQLVTKKVRA
jgi:putative ubiquitin-RnfH superfamily antitoxin RatB of RatAB toxin-antitoxin module